MNIHNDITDLDALIAQFIRHLRAERRASRYTVRNYEAALSRFSDFLTAHLGKRAHARDLERLELQDFRAFLSSRSAEGLCAASLKLDLSALKSFFKFIARRVQIENDAIAALKGPKSKARLPRPVSAAEAEHVIAAASEGKAAWVAARDAAIFTLLYGAGLRISEALSLKMRDAPFGEAIRIVGKGEKARLAPLLPAVAQALNRYLDLRPPAPDGAAPLFLSVRGKPLSARVVQREMKARVRGLGLDETATPHALRHAFATHLLAGGGDLRAVQELLGHASIAATQRYTKIEETALLKTWRAAHPRAE